MTWPLQSELDAFYGNPRGKNLDQPDTQWVTENIVRVLPPFPMTYAGRPARTISIHKKCAESLSRVLFAVWDYSGRKQGILDQWGASVYGGGFNYRLMRGGTRLSVHSWGAAIDLDPERNGFHDTTPNFANHPAVVKAFEDEGWTWGGRWSGASCDGMHFQAARVK
jgi:hypothetical protein